MDWYPPDRSDLIVELHSAGAAGNRATGDPIGTLGLFVLGSHHWFYSKEANTAHDPVSEDHEHQTVSVSPGLPNPSSTVPSGLLRLASVTFVGALAWYLPWLFVSIRPNELWLTAPLVAANLLTVTSMLLAILNNWYRRTPQNREVPARSEPTVGVLIPTCGEPPAMVARTIESVLTQDWPDHKLVVVVGDDARNHLMKNAVSEVGAGFPAAHVIYHEPPRAR